MQSISCYTSRTFGLRPGPGCAALCCEHRGSPARPAGEAGACSGCGRTGATVGPTCRPGPRSLSRSRAGAGGTAWDGVQARDLVRTRARALTTPTAPALPAAGRLCRPLGLGTPAGSHVPAPSRVNFRREASSEFPALKHPVRWLAAPQALGTVPQAPLPKSCIWQAQANAIFSPGPRSPGSGLRLAQLVLAQWVCPWGRAPGLRVPAPRPTQRPVPGGTGPARRQTVTGRGRAPWRAVPRWEGKPLPVALSLADAGGSAAGTASVAFRGFHPLAQAASAVSLPHGTFWSSRKSLSPRSSALRSA